MTDDFLPESIFKKSGIPTDLFIHMPRVWYIEILSFYVKALQSFQSNLNEIKNNLILRHPLSQACNTSRQYLKSKRSNSNLGMEIRRDEQEKKKKKHASASFEEMR